MDESYADAGAAYGYIYYGDGQWARLRRPTRADTSSDLRSTRVSRETVPQYLQHRANREYDGTTPLVLRSDSLKEYLVPVE